MSKKKSNYVVEGCYQHIESGLVVQERRRVKTNNELADHATFVVMIRGAKGSKFESKKVGNTLKGFGIDTLVKSTFNEITA